MRISDWSSDVCSSDLFTLEEIGELMAISGNYSDDMNEMRNASARKLEVVEERLAELTRMRDALRGLVDACPGHGPLATCPIMAALTTAPAEDEIGRASCRERVGR